MFPCVQLQCLFLSWSSCLVSVETFVLINEKDMRILVSLLVPFALVVLYASVRDINGSSSLNGCRMTWMWPDYVHVPIQSRLSKYALFRYQEGGEVKTSRVSVPVLFIPGNAGAYKQARSLGSVANAYANEHFGLRVFTIDSIDELSAFDSHLIKEQAEFTNDAIKSILDSYSSDASYRPTSVIIVAHSMGGIVAKSLFEAHNYVNGSVNSIITLATPHTYPPVAIEQNMVSLYSRLNFFWSNQFSNESIQHQDFRDLMLLSLAGGDRDAMIQSSYSEINAFVPPSHGFATYSTGVKDVWVSADHRCILWCNQLVHVLVRGLYGMIDFREPSKAVNLGTRIENWRSLLQYSNFEGKRDRVVGGEFAKVPKGKPEFITTKGNLALAPKTFTPNTYYGVPLSKDTVVKLFVEDVADVSIFGCLDLDMSTANIGQCRSISHLVERIPKRAPKREDGSVDETIGVFAVERSALEPFKTLIVRASGFTTEYGVLLVESSVLNDHKTVEYSICAVRKIF
ncbi:PGAP1-domain-containing protein [Rhizoclosmatium globosum]|uniref:GPI inositol-deacylase n=1 Tax=Rhizoclosmatium globosum TaxID=329046 RepID=A0A1Y2CST4_9FUNG|nr:PGAP1-domain-containing protein [Rhizoclosmatium globosum]|eukprot:ORY50099.1 PGAP1-domain-containing protein [Rhizoclosmatium globosum]